VSTADKYLAAAYLVLLLAVLAYVAIISLKLARFEREIAALEQLVRARLASAEAARPRRDLEQARG
jgi:hypothetical protein